MSFVYAEKRDDLIYIIADTFWQRPGLGIYNKWQLEPMVKIVVLPQGKIAAFAGNSEAAEKAFDRLFENAPSDAATVLLEANKASILAGQSVDFILADQGNLSLVKIANGVMQSVANAHLGSQTAFNLFQPIRHGTEETGGHPHLVQHVTKLPDLVELESANRYGAALRAFERVILEINDGSCGGFPISLFITKWKVSFGNYLNNTRAPLSTSEFSLEGVADVTFQDSVSGGYQIIVSGNETALSLHFPFGSMGFIYTGFRNDRLFAQKLTVSDPFDFAYEAEKAGCPRSIATWHSPANDQWKIRQLIESKQWDRAEQIMRKCVSGIIKKLSSQNPDIEFDAARNLSENLKSIDEFRVEAEDVELIGIFLDTERVFRDRMAAEAAENYDWWNSRLNA